MKLYKTKRGSVIENENGFSIDRIRTLVNEISYGIARGKKAISQEKLNSTSCRLLHNSLNRFAK